MRNRRFWATLFAVMMIVCAVATPFSAATTEEEISAENEVAQSEDVDGSDEPDEPEGSKDDDEPDTSQDDNDFDDTNDSEDEVTTEEDEDKTEDADLTRKGADSFLGDAAITSYTTDEGTVEYLGKGVGENVGAGVVNSQGYYDGVWQVDGNVEHGGPILTYHEDTAVGILKLTLDDGTELFFKDMNDNQTLDPYEDWRLSTDDRAAWLAAELDITHRLALMPHSGVGSNQAGVEDGRRFRLYNTSNAADRMAENNNQLQTWAENDTASFGIPIVTSTDPRHTGTIDTGNPEWNAEGGTTSKWPDQLGIAMTFDLDVVERYGEIVAQEYRALGIHMMLGPQMDLITDPRWNRDGNSWTEDLTLNADINGVYVEAMQTDAERDNDDLWGIDDDWGPNSVATMTKHWPSGGNGEFGFDGHADAGKFGVYPGGAFEDVLEAFAEGAGFPEEFKGTTRQSASVMPYYTISWVEYENEDGETVLNNVANAFSSYIINEMLREKYGYDGVVCTDWRVQTGLTGMNTPWGLEPGKGYTRPMSILMSMMAGVDQQGGLGMMGADDPIGSMQAAYDLGVSTYGEEFMQTLTERSATRILKIPFNLGLFENPYLNPDESLTRVGGSLNEEAFETHKGAVTMVKNAGDLLPIEDSSRKVYIPSNTNSSVVERYYDVVTDASDADFAIIWLNSVTPPQSGTNPQNLTYSPYTAEWQREQSLGYDWYYDEACTQLVQYYDYPTTHEEGFEKGYYRSNRSLNGRTHAGTAASLNTINETAQLMEGKPIVFVLNMSNPMVPAEFEAISDAILIVRTTSPEATMEIISGNVEPSGLLPVNIPMNMETVELSYEDAPHDMVPYLDSDGNRYTFGFGLNWSGQIRDERTATYADDILDRDYPLSEKRHIEDLIRQADALAAGDYTHTSYTMVSFARSFAENMNVYEMATQSQVNTAASLLRDAIAVLEPAGSSEPGVDKSTLAQVIAMTEAMMAELNEAAYTASSWSALTSALDVAKSVHADVNATQQQITQVINKLTAASESLELRNTSGNNGGGSSGGGSGSGSGNGKSSGWSSPGTPFGVSPNAGATSGATSSNVNSDGSVSQSAIAAEAATALTAVAEGRTATVRTQNAKSISSAALNALAQAADTARKGIVIHADTMAGGAVLGRLYIQPGMIAQDLQLGVYTQESQPAVLKTLFERWFSNKLAVVRFDQQGSFGARTQVAVKVDLSGMNVDNLNFYSYDQASNTYRLIANADHFVDANGYLHFYTSQAGSIIISEGALIKR